MVYVGYLQALRRYLLFSEGKSLAKTLSLFTEKWIKRIFSANQKAAFLRILQIVAQWLAEKRALNPLFWKMNLSSLLRKSSYKMRKRQIFNFLVMWIEVHVFIQKFLKRIEISVNIWNFTNWIEIYVDIRKFTRWIEISGNIRNFTN